MNLPGQYASNSSDDSNRNAELSTLYTHDTEGGLHLPLGSTSPIMRKLQHQNFSPHSNQYRLSDHTTAMNKIQPPPLELLLNSSSSNKENILTPRPSLHTSQSLPLHESAAASPIRKNKFSLQEKHAFQEWKESCREKELQSYEEAYLNIRAVLMQRRKRRVVTTKTANAHIGCSKPSSIGVDDDIIRHIDHATEMVELASHHRSWYQHNGKLVVLASLPHLSLQGVATHPIFTKNNDSYEEEIATLSPGCVIHATEMIVLDSRTLRQLYPPLDSRGHHDAYVDNTQHEDKQQHCCDAAKIQLLKITSPYIGYIVSHLHDYPYVAPGRVIDYVPEYKATSIHDDVAKTAITMNQVTTSTQWLWRVVYQPDGAFVRNGSELNSDHIGTLSYGSFCSVDEKIINDMGLSRLRIQACVKEDGFSFAENKEETRSEKNGGEEREWKKITGWISLFINPLSGNGGKIVEPVNFPAPV